uniref:Putative rna-directed dna polymerase from mobile element jockey-like protein n=1 Tax=Ixodes ricinus TaxID=34613 RepID=A0A6B0V325_IXORI
MENCRLHGTLKFLILSKLPPMMARKTNLYYQNTRGLRTKSEEFFGNAFSCDHDIICLTEMWLNEFCTSSSYFPSQFSVFRTDRNYTELVKYGGGVLIACMTDFYLIRRTDLETYRECVWVEIPASDGLNYFVGCYYFPPNSDVCVFVDHFADLENRIDFSKYKVHVYGDSNLPKVKWLTGFAQSDCAVVRDKVQCLTNFIFFTGCTSTIR